MGFIGGFAAHIYMNEKSSTTTQYYRTPVFHSFMKKFVASRRKLQRSYKVYMLSYLRGNGYKSLRRGRI